MADAGGDAEAAADRLEAALERIAALAARSTTTPLPEAQAAAPEVAERLDALIAHLRETLDGAPT
jgi:acyl-CoA reductase-like NAD-dependent aldehyde dehydrogenase